ncbi:amino acid adenylation domain-containing protein [Streptomyces sp. NPDC088812]|uniref:non-ribosomal peptide synthetase n=1 Tax=Streptomyces sp. NPDC088812 TaxID=3365905 RepID=UPI00382B7440
MTPQEPAAPATYPMSFEQESIWLQDQFHEAAGPDGAGRALDHSRYLESWIHHLRGPVETYAVEAALTALVAHQEALRSRLHTVDGRPVQTVLPPGPVPVEERWVTPGELDAAVLRAVTRPVPLDRPPLLRATLLRIADDEAVLALAVHHAVMDGWSARLLDEQIGEGYRAAVAGRPPRLPELPLQFGPYALRQRDDDAVRSAEHLAYWRTVLTDAPAESAFPGDRPRPARPSHLGGEVRFDVDGATGTALRRLARAERATPFVVLLSALTALLSRLSGQDDLVLGTPVSRRTGTEVKSLLGCLTDVMPLRQRIGAGETFRELVAATKATVWDAVRHRHIPYGHLVREFATERVLGRFPLFQVVFTLDDEVGDGLDLPGVTSERRYRHGGRSKFDVFLNLVCDGDGYRGFLEYADDLYDEETARLLGDRFAALLADAVARPDTALTALRTMPAHERARTAAWATGPRPPAPPPLAHLAVGPHAARTPRRPAVVHGTRTLTYRDLDARADRIAAALTALGHTGQPVGLCADRSLEHPSAVLGILRAGAACLPLDTSQPAERTAFVLRDAGARAVLADAAHAEALRTAHPDLTVLVPGELPPTAGAVAPPVSADAPAYVLYTSGSTGRPKGVAMTHRGLANLTDWQRRDARGPAAPRTLHFAPLTFDVAFQELFSTWAAGGTLVIADETARRDPLRLLALIRAQHVERLVLPFVALRQLAEHACAEGERLDSLREVLTSGEQLHVTPALRRMFGELTGAELQNQYGPTETHVVTSLRLAGDPAAWPDRPSLGRPIDGARVDVRDGALNPQPIGVPGEICVAGAPLAQGYVGHAAALPGGFVTGPDGQRLYRTGDIGRLLPDGTVDFLGRADDQVKIRGHRVEPREAESALRRLPGVADAVVVAVPGDTSAETALAAYYLPAAGAEVTPAAVREALRARLPAVSVPGRVEAVTAFPLTASGKTDRAALARRSPRPVTASPVAAPPAAGATVRRVTALWADLLGRDAATIGPDDDFFRLGGESLLGARLMLRLREECGVRLGLDAVYGAPTVAGLAKLVDAGAGATPGATADARHPAATTSTVAEPRLAEDIVPAPAAPTAAGPAHVLLTGATGFLGAYVLRELLRRTDATVHCLVRARDDGHARRRLLEAADRYGVRDAVDGVRTAAVAGDLARPGLGLGPARYDALAGQVDAVYHCGASVNLALPYAELAAVNVSGTEEVLRLAARHRAVPVHHVSTVGVFSGPRLLGRAVSAEEPLPPVDGLRHGYAQSKWAAESLVHQARLRGLPVTVHRPTRISGDSRTGICQPADFLWLLLKGCLEAGCYPADAGIGFDLVPVDYVSAAIVALSLAPSRAPAFHLAHGTEVPLTRLAGWLAGLGYGLTPVTLGEWTATVEKDPRNAAFPLLAVMAPEMVGTSSAALRFDGDAARGAARAHGVALRAMDEEVFERHVHQFTRTGFLPAPTRRAGGADEQTPTEGGRGVAPVTS